MVAMTAIGSKSVSKSFSKSLHQRSLTVIGLCLVDAALLVTSGVIHLHLQQTAYQHVKTIGPLFIVQFVSCLVLAAALLITRHILVALASVALMAGTIVGFILVRTVGLFDFKLPYSTTLANQVLLVEIVAVAIGLLTVWTMWRHRLD
jgi:xanthine/uracil permease